MIIDNLIHFGDYKEEDKRTKIIKIGYDLKKSKKLILIIFYQKCKMLVKQSYLVKFMFA